MRPLVMRAITAAIQIITQNHGVTRQIENTELIFAIFPNANVSVKFIVTVLKMALEYFHFSGQSFDKRK